MARVFVSHASGDLSVAEMIAGWLRDAGHRVFLDRDLEGGLTVGDAWGKRLVEELYQADALVAVVTAAFGQSQWCAAEVGIALANGVRLLPVRAEPGAWYRLISAEVQWTELDQAGVKARADLLTVLRAIDGADGTAWSVAPLIYPGLDAFTASQARVFFARDSEGRQLAERLRVPARSAERGLLAVVGPSGSGKSSLVRAGLVPRLAGDRDWLVLPVLVPAAGPVADPVGELARMLAGAGRHRGLAWTVSQVAEDLAGPGGITRLAAELLADAAPARHLLMIIDQAEELLDPAIPQAQRSRFVELLRAATSGPTRAVATIRTEFLDPLSVLAAETGLPVATFLVRPLARDMLPLVITGPARHAGITVSDELVAGMVADTGGGEALPLLAYSLNQLAIGVTRGGELSAQRYDALGGVRGALTRQADAALAEAAATTGRNPTDVLNGLLRLVTINDDGQPTRRRADLTTLPSHIRTELNVFVDQRLLTIHRPDADGDSGAPVIDIAHEQILTAWQPLADAITAAADTLRLQADVTDAATAWNRDNRPKSHLWELDRSRRAARGLNFNDLSRTTQEFLTTSRRHGQRRRLRTTAILTVLLLLVTAGFFAALIQRNQAVDREERATSATARVLTLQAEQFRGRDTVRALRLGLAADAIASGPETLAGLKTTLAATPWTANVDDDQNLTAVAFSPDGRTVATTSNFSGVERLRDINTFRNGGRLRLWDTADLRTPVASVDDDQNLTVVAFSPDGHTVATASEIRGDNRGRLRLWDTADLRTPVASFDAAAELFTAVVFSPDGHTVATTSNPRFGGIPSQLRLWDVANLDKPVASVDNDQFLSGVVFNSDGRTLATIGGLGGRPGGRLQLWDVGNLGKPVASVDDDQFPVGVAFNPDSRTLATISALGGPGGRLRLWDVGKLDKPVASVDDDQFLSGVTFSPDGRTVATTSGLRDRDRDGGRLRLWDVANLGKPVASVDDDQFLSGVAFSPDGPTVATTSGSFVDRKGGRLRLRDTGNLRTPVASVDDDQGLTAVAFSPDGRTVATSGRSFDRGDGRLQLWDVANLDKPIASVDDNQALTAMAFSPDGRTVATTSGTFFDRGGGRLQLWDVANLDKPIASVDDDQGFTAVAFSPDGRTVVTTSHFDNRYYGGRLRLWDARNLGKPVASIDDDQNFSAVAFSPDGRTVATTSQSGVGEGRLRLWDVGNLGRPAASVDDDQSLTGLVFSPDGRTVATTSQSGVGEGRLRLWDIYNSRVAVPLFSIDEDQSLTAVAFSRDGRTLVTTSSLHSRLHLNGGRLTARNMGWSVDLPRHMHGWACAAAGGGFSEKEWNDLVAGIPYMKTCT